MAVSIGLRDPSKIYESGQNNQTENVYGRTVQISAGHRVITGMPIWCSSFRNTIDGSSVPVNVNPGGARSDLEHIVATFMLAFGYPLPPDAEVEDVFVARVWANDVLIYDVTSAANSKYPDLAFKVYHGRETQGIDPVYKADKGDLAPAYRGMIYIRFTDFPIGALNPEKALTIPPIRVEFADQIVVGVDKRDFDLLAPTDEVIGGEGMAANWNDQIFWGFEPPLGATESRIHEFDIVTEAEVSRRGVGRDDLGVSFNSFVWDEDRKLYAVSHEGDGGTGNSVPLAILSAESGTVRSEVGGTSTDTNPDPNDDTFPQTAFGSFVRMRDGGEDAYGLATLSFVDDLLLFKMNENGSGLTWQKDQSVVLPSAGLAACEYPVLKLNETAAGSQFQDFSLLIAYGNKLQIRYGGWRGSGPQWLGTREIKDFGSPWEVRHIIVDPLDGGILCFVRNSSTTNWRAVKFKCAVAQALLVPPDILPSGFRGLFPDVTLEPIYDVSITSLNTGQNFVNGVKYSNLKGGTLGFPSGTNCIILDTASGEFQSHAIGETVDGWLWDSERSALFVDPGRIIEVGKVSASGATTELANILRWLALRAGYEDADIEVDVDIVDDVEGIIITEPYDPWTLFGTLGEIYQFTAFESEDKIKFVKSKTGDDATPAVGTLSTEDLSPISEGSAGDSDVLLTRIAPPEEVASSVSLEYVDSGADFEYRVATFNQDNETAQATGTQTVKYRVPIVMGRPEAYERAAFLGVLERESNVVQQFRLPQRYLRLEPSDVLEIDVNFANKVRLEEATVNGDFSISCLARNINFDSAFAIPGDDDVDGNVDIPPPGDNDTLPLALDVPLLSPDQDVGLNRAAVMAGVRSHGQDNWQGGHLFFERAEQIRQPNGEQIPAIPETRLLTTNAQVLYGVAASTLAATQYPHQIHEVSIDVVCRNFEAADLTGTDAAGLLAGTNAILVGTLNTGEGDARLPSLLSDRLTKMEMIFWRDVTVLGPKTARLTGLVRGRRGTDEWARTRDIVAGDLFVMVRSANTDHGNALIIHGLDPASRGLRHSYLGVGAGLTERSGLTTDLFAASLRPWAPAGYLAEASGGDVVLSWLRRNRVVENEILDDPIPDLPSDDEASEAYEVDVLDGPGGTVLRTFTGLSSPTVTYTAAQQAADGWTDPLTEVTVKVYQISARVGRGFTQERTLHVN